MEVPEFDEGGNFSQYDKNFFDPFGMFDLGGNSNENDQKTKNESESDANQNQNDVNEEISPWQIFWGVIVFTASVFIVLYIRGLILFCIRGCNANY